MNWDTFSKLLLRLAAYLVAAGFLYSAWHTSKLHEITAQEAEGINTLILLIGSIYAVIFAFVIFVIWGQFTDVENFMMRECKSLHELLRFSEFLGDDAARSIQRAVADYVQRVVKSEWPALGARRRDKATEQTFSELLDTVLIAPKDGIVFQVMDYPLCDRHLQMALVDRDQEVEALAPQACAQPFTDCVGPGRPNRSSKNSHSAVRHFLIQLLGEDGVPLVDHKTIGMIARKCLAELLQRPFRSRMSGHVVGEDTTASDLHPHEYVQVSKSGCDHDEKVTGHDDLGMVVAEGQPARFRIRRTYWTTVSQVLLHGARETRIPSFSCSSWA